MWMICPLYGWGNNALPLQIKPFNAQKSQLIFCLISIQPLSHKVVRSKVHSLMCHHGDDSFPLQYVRHVCAHISIGLLIWWWPIRSSTSSLIVYTSCHCLCMKPFSLPSLSSVEWRLNDMTFWSNNMISKLIVQIAKYKIQAIRTLRKNT